MVGKKRELDSLKAYTRALKQGFGIGEGDSYRPWIRLEDIGNIGTAIKIQGIKAKRTHHLLSQGEKQFFYLAEFSPRVLDIREQFPLLPLDLAIQVAQCLDVTYPKVPATQTPHVMTTDFLLTLEPNETSQSRYMAVSVKPRKDLAKERTLEKLEIERVWWELLGVPFYIFTGSPECKSKADDIAWLSLGRRRGDIVDRSSLMDALKLIQPGTFSLTEICEEIQQTLLVGREQALTLFKSLVVDGLVSLSFHHSILETQLVEIIAIKHAETVCWT
jgi:hypothetical protein